MTVLIFLGWVVLGFVCAIAWALVGILTFRLFDTLHPFSKSNGDFLLGLALITGPLFAGSLLIGVLVASLLLAMMISIIEIGNLFHRMNIVSFVRKLAGIDKKRDRP